MKLEPAETRALHECLNWLRSEGNNPVHKLFGTVYESFLTAGRKLGRKLAARVSAILPEGAPTTRIRMTPRPAARPKEGTVGDTIGDERTGFVLLDGKDGIPYSHSGLDVLRRTIATQEFRVQVEVPNCDR